MTIPATLRALHYRNFQRFFGGHTISPLGGQIQICALTLLACGLTGSPFWLGLVNIPGQFPVFLLSPLGGIVAGALLLAARATVHGLARWGAMSAAAVGVSLRALAISHSFRRSCELLRGRAISAYSMTLMAAPVLGAGLSGVAAIHWGVHATAACGGIVCVAATVACGWRWPGLRTEARRVIDAAERQPGAAVA